MPWSGGPRRGGWGPPKRWGPYPHGHMYYRRRRWGLRRRLTFAFVFVALAAVTLTTWFTLGAVFDAQRDLFQTDGTVGTSHQPGEEPGFAAAREAFGRVTRTAFWAGVVSFFLASGAAVGVTRVLTRPLIALTDGARRLEAGERGIRLEPPTARDELRGLTEAFNNLVAGLERQEAWRRALVADIAHDLRTPLSVMRSEIEAMQDGLVVADEAALDRLHGEVMRLSRLVDDLRTLSLAEGGGLPLERSEVPLLTLLERLQESYAARAHEAGVAIDLSGVDPTLAAFVDPDQLQRLLGNLLDNALRYAAPGAVEIAGGAHDGNVQLAVRDRGPGLSEEDLERAFERFYRGDPSRTRRPGQGASGLGLAIARAIAEAHGGSLDVENHPQGGALFTLELPTGEAPPTPEA